MDRVLEAVERHTRYHRAWLLLPVTPTRGLEIVGYALADRARVQEMMDIDFSNEPFIRLRFEANEPLVWDDLRNEPLANQEHIAHFGNRTLISIPMVRVAERIGTFCIGTFAEEGVVPPLPREVEFAAQVAALVSVVAGRIRAEQAQRAIEERASNALRLESLGRMAGEIAHDFNNMLTSILGNNSFALELLLDHPARELLVEVDLAASRAAQMTRQLLAFSRGQALEMREIVLVGAVDGIVSMLRSLLPANITLDVTHCGPPTAFLADKGQVEQLIMNLVINARDAMPDGGSILLSTDYVVSDNTNVTAHASTRSDHKVVLTVADSGAGMTDEVRARIFEPLYTTKPAGVGTGLGLAAVDSVLKRHGGSIEVESQPGRGTTFRVYFPALDRATAAVTVRSSEPAAGLRGDGLVLVVDDDADVRLLVDRVLSRAGYRVLLAADGQEALDLLSARSDISLVLTDLVMPRVGGDELRERIGTRHESPPVLIMSGYMRGAAARQDYEHVLAKPFLPQQLLAKVQEVINNTRYELPNPGADAH